MVTENIWAPWRMAYIRQLDQDDAPAQKASCFICDAALAQPDTGDGKNRLLLVNDDRGLILLNRYPYTNGHLLVAPGEHLAELSDLNASGRARLMELTHLAEQLVRDAMNAQGVNIGINLGRCAGAGLPGHLHIHIVPRWSGDTNFITTVGQVRVVPEALEQSHAHLSETLAKMVDG